MLEYGFSLTRISPVSGFYPPHLSTAVLHPKDSVSLLFAEFGDPAGWPHGGHRRENCCNLGLQIAVKCIFLGILDFYWKF